MYADIRRVVGKAIDALTAGGVLPLGFSRHLIPPPVCSDSQVAYASASA